MTKRSISFLLILITSVAALVAALQHEGAAPGIFSRGYKDTPILPGTEWHVHDSDRPFPRWIDPGTCSTQARPGQPPSDAIVLFNGRDLSKWRTEKGGPASWKVENGYVEVVPGTGDIYSREDFGDMQLHVELQEPLTPAGETKPWGNSGVFLYGVFEVQVWDSYHQNNIYADGQAGAIYGQYPPLVNASRKDGQWQDFDIIFNLPRFQGGKLVTPAYVTVLHDGVVIHNHTPLFGETRPTLPSYADHGPKGPVSLQDHEDRVRYRNIWVRPLRGYDQP